VEAAKGANLWHSYLFSVTLLQTSSLDGFQTGQHKVCVRPSIMSWRQMAKCTDTCCYAQPTAAVGNIPLTPRCQWIWQDRQCTYKRNTEARSSNHCCSGKAISITYWQRVCVPLVIQHEMRMSHIVIFGLPRSTIFPNYLKNDTIFEGKKNTEHKVCGLIVSTTFVRKFLNQ